ncbi:NB-ARC domain-containing protein [Nocardioides daphniae]|uniref:Uncharacterized protein n=1 Tax=Nocardioides daphniae TaxID=402297 RepID=A0A4V1CWI5_9ACTN|nr:NB-ARC domain-containing protein [Nocardioides daphniae]QCC77387.1 hypothetical protein E2C04_09720 [Nocardioides daphniae]
MSTFELEITADLDHGLREVLGEAPATADAVVVLAAFLDSMAKGHGLSENGTVDDDPVVRLGLPGGLDDLLTCLMGYTTRITADLLREGLYLALTQVAADQSARKMLNKSRPLSEEAVLLLGQIYWNIEASEARSLLPIRPHVGGGRLVARDIPVPGSTADFATMRWTARANRKCSGKSAGQGFRKQGARLVVLVAQRILAGRTTALDGPVSASVTEDDERLRSLTWTWDEPDARSETLVNPPSWRGKDTDDVTGDAPIYIGPLPDVGPGYQSRFVDFEIGHHWATSGERRVWLTGGPGLGKSYTARKIMEDALRTRQGETLLVWVESADVAAVHDALGKVGEALRARGLMPTAGGSRSPDQESRAVLDTLATSPWRWLVVLDNAEADALIAANLLPTGTNPCGRTLVTTTSRSPRMRRNGQVFEAAQFQPDEAREFLRNNVHAGRTGRSAFAAATDAELDAVAQAVGNHPLGLAIAAGTISTNALTIEEWLREFASEAPLDQVADELDHGGYPRLIAATWRMALAKASQGLPDGLAERAALVAAVQAADGHPTWLWDTDAVAGWVAGGNTLERRHGMPKVVQRLIDHHVVELQGSWSDGRLRMHQLASRAVREHVAEAVVAELVELLCLEWVKRLTVTEPEVGVLLANVDALASVCGPHAQAHVLLTRSGRSWTGLRCPRWRSCSSEYVTSRRRSSQVGRWEEHAGPSCGWSRVTSLSGPTSARTSWRHVGSRRLP